MASFICITPSYGVSGVSLSVVVSETDLTINTLLQKVALETQKRIEVEAADIVVVPEFDFRGHTGRAFMPDTVAFYKFAKAELPDRTIAIAEQPGKESIIDLRSADLWLPTLIVQSILLPLLVNIIWELLKKLKADKERGQVHVAIIVEDRKQGKAKRLSYDGPSDAFADAFAPLDVKELLR